jgi:GMP synthase-like glutamine amidotransferase
MARVAILRHSRGTPPGRALRWAQERGHVVQIYELDLGSPLPKLADFDALISLGGPMNCDDEARWPWLKDEKILLAEAIQAKQVVLGLCLGAQLIARSQGAAVRPNAHWESGWHKVLVRDEYLGEQELFVFQWHRDTFDLPSSAQRIATNGVTENQAFRLSDRVVGTQFHPETEATWVEALIVDPDQPPDGPYVQREGQLREGLSHLPTQQAWLDRLMRQMFDAAGI